MVEHADFLVIDGAHGEGGGQILRTSLSLSVLLRRPIRIENIRKSRKNPGLAAQHLTAVHAAASLCGAKMRGDSLGSTELEFVPTCAVEAGNYHFDVGAARAGGSSGAATLVLQTVVLPLAGAHGRSNVVVDGGTHMSWSPPYDYLAEIWRPLLERLGVKMALTLERAGWFPLGRGRIAASIDGRPRLLAGGLRPLQAIDRGALGRVTGRALAANLPEHIPQRMADRARHRLLQLGAPVAIDVIHTESACPGTGLFLTACYEGSSAGFSALGERGKPAEAVADEAVDALLAHDRTGASLDRHLADQALLPLALAAGPSRFSIEAPTLHFRTNSCVIERFGIARVVWQQPDAGLCIAAVEPRHG